ncbi:TIGR01777 family oxidoreductase [Bremerella sp. P1]|uniref:TIGR01777 family oxidoreductase n=1 Tax=Bremerella sp. P1 TaxID=3026424 RepID=UPI0023679212|nr:TIGR01777 family oxidoreductase [Bremerella sp. P1]WDI42271.1 TIGR01777 family oxidoreductase [Bremerella sp. P1]
MFTFRSKIPVSVATAFHWHEQPGALDRLIPPWEDVQIEQRSRSIAPGSRVVLKMHVGGFPVRWVAEHTALEPNKYFHDRQVSGPFARWEHTHRFLPSEDGQCVLEDEVDYQIPGGSLGTRFGRSKVEKMLLQMFRYRHDTTTYDLIAHARYQERPTMKIAITGASGLVGSQLGPFLTTGGHQVVPISRSAGEDTIQWDIKKQEIDTAKLEGLDAVIHLAGESVAARWTDKKKQAIRSSRVDGTRLLCESLAKLENKPKVLVCASAMGFYGDRGDEILTEASPPGDGFLADVCQEWEAAAQPARDAGIRVVHARIGIVLSPKGGALAQMLTPFKLGVGGKISTGKQWWSWISLDDVVGSLHHLMMNDNIQGPVNLCTPKAVTNEEFTKTLGKVISRPTFFTVPQFAAKLAMGEMADEMLLSSCRMEPKVLEQTEYHFREPNLERCLRKLLGRQ